nr:MAG TPA: hypothetical protein [Caudoviricetes sp.]
MFILISCVDMSLSYVEYYNTSKTRNQLLS